MRTLLLDFGNVVGFFDHRRAARRLAELAAPGTSEAAIFDAVFSGTLERDFDCGRLSASDFLAHLRALTRAEASDEVLADAWCNIFWPNRPMAASLPQLKMSGWRLVLASNTNALHFDRAAIEFAGELAHFDDLVLSFRVGARKPERRFFDACLAAAQCPAAECVFVDDKREFVDAARRLGIPAIAYHEHEVFLSEVRRAGITSP